MKFDWQLANRELVNVSSTAPAWVRDAFKDLEFLWELRHDALTGRNTEEAERYDREVRDLEDALTPYFVPVQRVRPIRYKR